MFSPENLEIKIYVIGSVHNYGDISIKKEIVLIGPGYFLTKNTDTHVNKKAAIFDDVTINIGAENTVIKGIAAAYYTNSGMQIYTDKITILNCYIYDNLYLDKSSNENLNDIVIKHCYLRSAVTHPSNYYGQYSNFIFANNILNGSFSTPSGSEGVISNNLFLSDVFKPGVTSSFQIINNILYSDNPGNVEVQPLPNVSVSHNISISNILGTDNNNQAFVTEGTIFVGADGNSTDGQYQLATNSPARNAGKNGVDIGPFGGPEPYRLSGLPQLPNIYEISTGGFVVGDELPVHIKIKQQ